MGHNRPVVAAVVVAVGLVGGCAGGDGDPDTRGRTSSTDVSVTVPTVPTTTAPTTAAPTTAAPFPPKVGLAQVARLDEPVAFAVRNGDDALYIAEKKGRVRAVRGGTVDAAAVLDIRGQVSLGNEQGLLGLAFSPDGRHLYIDYTDRDGDTRVVEYAMAGTRADPASRRQLLTVDQPAANHNGGHLVFGPDGFLYIGLGDGGGAGDPDNRAQDRGTLLGKILRIDPRADGDRPYRIPPGNPFAGQSGLRAEIWAYGLRNPWRFSFDRDTGELWIGDVGQSQVEEINRQPGDRAGVNYGWSRREGTRRFKGARPAGAVDPVYEYGRDGGCSVTGGFVYRGQAIAGLQGAYLFIDHCQGRLIALRPPGGSADGPLKATPLGISAEQVTSFGEDASGELYLLSRAGPLFRLVPAG